MAGGLGDRVPVCGCQVGPGVRCRCVRRALADGGLDVRCRTSWLLALEALCGCHVAARADYDIGLPVKFCLDRDLGRSSEWNIERNRVYHWGASRGGTAREK